MKPEQKHCTSCEGGTPPLTHKGVNMNTLHFINHIKGFAIEASDGVAAKVKDFYFDDGTWSIAHIVAEIPHLLGNRLVLLAPGTLMTPDWQDRTIATSLARVDIEACPDVDVHLPVAVELQRHLDTLTTLDSAWPESFMGLHTHDSAECKPSGDEPHLRSTGILSGVTVKSADGSEVGSLLDFVLDATSWKIPYLLFSTSKGGLILMDSAETERIDVSRRLIILKGQRKAQGEVSGAGDPRCTAVFNSGNRSQRPVSAYVVE